MPVSEESKCDTVIATMYGTDAIVQLGRKGKRTPNTKGVPDRLYFAGNRLIWFEVKSATDYLSPKQIQFLSRVLATNGVAGCGGRADLLELLNAPKPYLVGHAQIEKYRTRSDRSAK